MGIPILPMTAYVSGENRSGVEVGVEKRRVSVCVLRLWLMGRTYKLHWQGVPLTRLCNPTTSK